MKAVGIALFCGAIAFTATWVRRRQLTASENTRRTATLTPLTAGLTAMVGALLGIAIFQRWPG